ncbi:hypothetical protein [Frigoribacterium sp. VKM Ac-2836]|uniref:hypothetical protein n=1 Tax=Frigoribacterium sp. VKM Ac-2836 TaxID=2739014 RepID=UPI0015678B7C|nr:hypothetical protein [Frigoribacterium sp. VKM Ac-2836]NRD27128.1 hypothetical protein [Frigoribacterium sp. VKM Ac-2836]
MPRTHRPTRHVVAPSALTVAGLAVALLLSGCSGGTPAASSSPGPSTTRQAEPSPTASDIATALPDATALPETEPPAPATAEAQEAPPAWHACVTAIGEQNPDLPFLGDVWAYEADDVQDSDTGAVATVTMGHLADGRPATEWTCRISGTPESPVVDSVTPADV